MSLPGVDQVGERALEELVQRASQQTLVLAREQLDAARRELLAGARQTVPGAAMLGGGALLTALASGTGTAALIMLLARRPRASAAALGVTGAYAGTGAFLARQGLARLRRQVATHEPDTPVQDEPVEDDEQPAKRRTKSAASRVTKSAAGTRARTKSATKLAAQEGARVVKPKSRTPSSRRAPSTSRTARTRRRAS